mgnify:CR=1 FL=1
MEKNDYIRLKKSGLSCSYEYFKDVRDMFDIDLNDLQIGDEKILKHDRKHYKLVVTKKGILIELF